MKESKLQKAQVLFKYHSSVLDKTVSETMWADVIDKEKGVFKLDNIPFYGPPIAREDVFIAEYQKEEQALVYNRTIESSGNSIVLVVILREGIDKELFRKTFADLNCPSEGVSDNFFSMEIKKDTDYTSIKRLLHKMEAQQVLSYAEPCLSAKHKRDIQPKAD